MKKRTNIQYARAFYELWGKTAKKDWSELAKNFTAVLVRDQKLKQADKIIKELIKYSKKKEGVQEIEVTFARKTDDKILEKIKSVFGEKVEATIKIEPEMLGGVKIKTADRILDAGLLTQLKKLKQSLV